MRDVKFKAWDKNRKRFIDLNGFYIAFGSMLNIGAVYGVTEQGVLNEYTLDEIELIEFTGLKDKDGKGKEIFHKDLIVNQSRNDRGPHIVEWSDKFGGWVGLYGGLEYLIAQELHEIELVGNFFENSEML